MYFTICIVLRPKAVIISVYIVVKSIAEYPKYVMLPVVLENLKSLTSFV
jgi:hypothetical protein